MRAKTLILFVIAIGCGLVASIGVSQYMERAAGSAATTVETAGIFVALTDINIGEKLDAENVKLEEWPLGRIPEGAIYDLEDLEDRYPRTRFYVGEPILVVKLMDSNDGSKSVDIPSGYRVVSVKVTVESGLAGLVQPGDRVDLLVFLRKGTEVPETGTRTILRDVNVFAVDAETERTLDAEGQARNVRTVSLLVKPDQAEAVMLASEMGLMSLTLRRPDDDIEDDSEGYTVHSLLGNEPESANDKSEQQTEVSGGGFADWLANTATAAIDSAPVMGAPIMDAAPPVVEPVWTMRILTPEGYREFEWHDPDQLPNEVEPGGPAVSLSPNLAPMTGVELSPATIDPATDVDGTEEMNIEDS